MAFIGSIVGLALVLTVLNGTYKDLGSALYTDLFTGGTGGFIAWVFALVVIGLIAYIPGMKKPAYVFLALVIVVMLLANQGLFAKIMSAIQSGPSAPTNATPLQAIPLQIATANASAAGLPTSVASGANMGFPALSGITGLLGH